MADSKCWDPQTPDRGLGGVNGRFRLSCATNYQNRERDSSHHAHGKVVALALTLCQKAMMIVTFCGSYAAAFQLRCAVGQSAMLFQIYR